MAWWLLAWVGLTLVVVVVADIVDCRWIWGCFFAVAALVVDIAVSCRHGCVGLWLGSLVLILVDDLLVDECIELLHMVLLSLFDSRMPLLLGWADEWEGQC